MNLIPFKGRGRHYRASGQQITCRDITPTAITTAAAKALGLARAGYVRDTGTAVPAGAWVLVSVTLFTPELTPRNGPGTARAQQVAA